MALGLSTLRRIGPLGAAMTLGQIAWAVRHHWVSIPADQRARLTVLLRKAKGRPSNLSTSERRELRQLVAALRVPTIVRRAAVDVALSRRLRP
jgi:hypothetical protein